MFTLSQPQRSHPLITTMAMMSTTTMAMATAVKRSIWLRAFSAQRLGARQASARRVRDDLALVEAARLIIPAKTLMGWSLCFPQIFAKNVSVKESGISPDRAEYRSTS